MKKPDGHRVISDLRYDLREVPFPVFGPFTNYPDWKVLRLSAFIPGKCWDVTL